MKNLSYPFIREMYLKLGYRFFSGPLNVNLFGIRSKFNRVDEFNDVLGIAYQDEFGHEMLLLHKATTDPGSFWLKNKRGHLRGTAILVPGQYRGAWKIGQHRGYQGLVQAKNGLFLVWRDHDQDGEMDMTGPMHTDVRGLNMHTTSFKTFTDKVGAYSAGCQVYQNAEDFKMVMALIRRSAEAYGNSFTYTLFDETNFQTNIIMSEKLGTDHIKTVAGFGFNLVESLGEKLEDGKIRLFEAIDLIKDLKDTPRVVSAASGALAEFQDLDRAEKEELLLYFNKKFDLNNDVLERRIEKALAIVAGIIDLINDINSGSH